MKPTFPSYNKWFIRKFNIDLNNRPSSKYQYVIQKLSKDFDDSGFWKDLINNLKDFNDEYYLKNGYVLLKPDKLILFTKPYESLLNKSYRKNILNNDNFPKEPNCGWITPDNWFSTIKDLIRTSLTVRYLDGVEFIVNKIKELAEKNGFQFYVDYEAREEGYYAAHITLQGKFQIIDDDWNPIEILFPIEIQITTQLQEVIKTLLHKMYEETRVSSEIQNCKKWQWDYKSIEFSSNYLGHILHFVEGMILEVRDKQKQKQNNQK